MSFCFRPAVRDGVGLLVGLAGGTGSGKTYSAMRLAKGISGGKRFAVIDTEAGRAKHYADQFDFDHGDLKPPFRPDAYEEAIKAADAAGYPVILVDSMSHEHDGEGGLLEWHEENLGQMVTRAMQKNPNASEWQLREAMAPAAWIKPKAAHKHMVQRLLQVRAHLVLCFRAEEKIEFAKENGKTVIRPKQTLAGKDGWVPISEKRLPFELTASFLLTADAPGIPKPIKLQEQHRSLFPLNMPITEESGRMLAEWAKGSAAQQVSPSSNPVVAGSAGFITEEQMVELDQAFAECDKSAKAAFLKVAKLEALDKLKAEDYPECKDWIERRRVKQAAGATTI